MDVLYVVGTVSPNRHNELRYSLRSVARNFPHDRVIVAGHCPSWLTGASCVPGKDTPANKNRGIQTKLLKALESGKVATAALDVFETEPLPADSPLRKFDHLMFGTHNGSNTAEAVDRVNRLTVDLAYDLFGISGQPPRLVPLVTA